MVQTHCPTAYDLQLVGDPVDTYTGAVVDQMLDFRLTGPLELRWTRYHDSRQADRHFSVGRGCAHEFDRNLRLEADALVYEEGTRRTLRFPRLGRDGAECALHGLTLKRLSPLCYLLLQHAQPAMEFSFAAAGPRARLGRLMRGEHQVRFVHDRESRLVAIQDSAGRRLRCEEDDAGHLLSVSVEATAASPSWLLVAYRYDAHGNLVETRNHEGYGYRFDYDAEHRVVRRRGRTGFEFHFKYDAQGRCTLATGDRRLFGVALDYRVPERVTRVTHPDLGVWTYKFGAGGALESIGDPSGGVRRFVRDAGGRLLLDIDPNGNASSFHYDAAGAAVVRIDTVGRWVHLPVDPNSPDAAYHRVAATPAEYGYGRMLDVAGIQLPTAGELQAWSLDSSVRELAFQRPEPQPTLPPQPAYEVPPLRTAWWPAPATHREFNALGKLIRQHDAFGRMRRWRYDASGNPVEYVDFDGGRWTYEYGFWHFITRFTNPVGAEVRCDFTAEGLLSACTSAGQARSEFEYDRQGHLIAVKRHGVVRDRYTRDACGNLVAKHDASGKELLRIEIGPGNLPIRKQLASGDEHTFKYDRLGRHVAVATRADAVNLAYDDLGNCTQDRRNGVGVELTFSDLHAPALCVFNGRFEIGYARDGSGVVTISDPSGGQHRLRQWPGGLLEQQFSNGSAETCQFDERGRFLFKSAFRQRKGLHWNRRFHWSGEGELRRVDDNLFGEAVLDYDAAHRLRARRHGGRIEEFELDLADNLLSQPGLVGVKLLDGNRLAAANGDVFLYNSRNHIGRRERDGGSVQYHYDSRDQLIGVEWTGGRWTADYDALGRRSRKTFNGRTTEFYWYSDQLVAEVDPDGRLRLYVYADPLAQVPLLFVDYDSVDASPASGARFFVFADQLGAPCLIENDSGDTVWQAANSPFGCADVAPGASIEFNIRLPGHYFDAELGLHYNRFRHYDPLLARYLQSDPWGVTGGVNLYAYRTNPLLVSDVRGLGEEHGPDGKKVPKDEEGNHVSPLTGESVEGSVKVCQKTVDGEVVARYYLDDQGRTVRAEGLLDPPSSYKKSGVGHVEPEGFESGRDHRGHLIPERSAASQPAVNVPENVIAEHGTKSNLSEKKRWENQARDHASSNEGTWSVHEPHYDGENPRPSSVTHSLVDADGNEVPNKTKTIPNPED